MTLSELSQAYLYSANGLEERIAGLKNIGKKEYKIKALESLCAEERQLAETLMAYIERKEKRKPDIESARDLR